MKYVIVRDDDVSFFTNPEFLEKLYAPFFKARKPISFAVIPKITSNIKTDSRNPYRKKEQLEYDPIIPPIYRGINHDYPIYKNQAIIEYLQNLDTCEILQHGLTHGLADGTKEFRIKNKTLLESRALEGKKILTTCLKKSPDFFVAPWDNFSLEAFDVLKSNYKGLSMGRINPTRLPMQAWFSYIQKLLFSRNFVFFKNFLISSHSGYILSRFNNPDAMLDQVKREVESKNIVIIVNHHWEYFYDWTVLDAPFFSAWNKVTDYLLQKEDIEIISFNELYRVLKDN